MNKNIRYSYQLDHVRAIGAFLVFSWHFLHINNLHTITPNFLFFPISLITEGHTGVSIFMTLSGYLFAKILMGKKVNYKQFYLNRFWRLIPLLFVTTLLQMYLDGSLTIKNFSNLFFRGFINRNWPYAGWSISVELHFYYLLPLILLIFKQMRKYFFIVFIFTIGVKIFILLKIGELQHYSYFKIFGHIDEFLLGFAAFKYRNYIKNQKKIVLILFLLFNFFYYWFELKGGFYRDDSYPSNSPFWVFIPFLSGLSYSTLISYYDNNNFDFLKTNFSIFISKIGLYSYSIYLWHFVFVFNLSKIIDKNLISVDNLFIGTLLTIPTFMLSVFIGFVSYNIIEKPFFKFKKKYIIDG